MFSNCFKDTDPGIPDLIFSASATAPSMPFSFGVLTIFAPRALIIVCFSSENFVGTVNITS